MLSYHNDPKIKDFYLNRVKEHAKLDEIEKGYYWENGKGCAVGCTIHGNDHSKYEKELGIPIILARLEDRIFENLPNDLAKTWPQRFLEGIQVGKDLSKVWPKFAIFLLTDITQCNSRHLQCEIVSNAYKNELNGEKQNWIKIKKTAYAAAADYIAAAAAYIAADAAAAAAAAAAYIAAAYIAADADAADAYIAAAYIAADADAADAYAAAYAAYAAADAADAAAYAAAYAAAAAYIAADASSIKQNAFITQSEKLLQLLRET